MLDTYPPLNPRGNLIGLLVKFGIIEVTVQTVSTKVAYAVPSVIASLKRRGGVLVAENKNFVVYMYLKQ